VEPSSPLLDIRDLTVSFGDGRFQAVKGVDFQLFSGEVVGLVGESGSGKSLTAFSLMGLLPHGARLDRGAMIFQGQDLVALDRRTRRELCGRRMGMVFQEPLTALNPVLTIGEQTAEIFRLRDGRSAKEARRLAVELLGQVGLPNPERAAESYPHRFSGGMRQRVVIAMALALKPALVIADEPTTALDPTIAAQIVRLLKNMAAERRATVLFITHNLKLLAGLARRVMVMYAGRLVEQTGADFADPLHPYAQGLLKAIPPDPADRSVTRLAPIPGQPSSLADDRPGCPFEPRCPERRDRCARELPPMFELPDGRLVRCFQRAPQGDGQAALRPAAQADVPPCSG
jgi:oligopeptide/dipeptide ABC transporter ATP-binding protein